VANRPDLHMQGIVVDAAPNETGSHPGIQPAPSAPRPAGCRSDSPFTGISECGSHVGDWVRGLGSWSGTARWDERLHRPNEAGIDQTWIDLHGIETSAALFEIRECVSDRWWPLEPAQVPWCEASSSSRNSAANALEVDPIVLAPLPGDQANHASGAVRFRSRFMEVGFCLRRAVVASPWMTKERTDHLLRNPAHHAGVLLHPSEPAR
jgi:hypothetical protein